MPKPRSNRPSNAAFYPEGGPGRQPLIGYATIDQSFLRGLFRCAAPLAASLNGPFLTRPRKRVSGWQKRE